MWRRLVVVILALGVLAGCELRQLPGGGYLVIPDQPNGRRVLIIGDSLIRQPSLSVAFSLMDGGATTRIDATNTSGLVSGPVHWDERAGTLIDEFHPTHVLIGLTGNFTAPYWPGYQPPGSPGSAEYEAWLDTTFGSTDWLDRNREAAVALTEVFTDAGVEVYWVEPPPFPPQYGSLPVSDAVWDRVEAAVPGVSPQAHVISARSSVATASSGWLRYKMICGTTYEIRSWAWDGGVHFTADGAGTYGRALARALAAAESWPAPPAHCPGQSD